MPEIESALACQSVLLPPSWETAYPTIRPATSTTPVMMIGVQLRCCVILIGGGVRRFPLLLPCVDGRPAPGALPAPVVLLAPVADFALTRTVPGLRVEESPPPCGVLMLLGPRWFVRSGQGYRGGRPQPRWAARVAVKSASLPSIAWRGDSRQT